VTYSYDAIDRPTAVNDSVGGNISWVYDTVNSGHHPRMAETTSHGTVTTEFDKIGRRLKLSATGQTDVTYTYDKNSRLKTVMQGTTTVSLAYDDAGRRTTLTYPNGVVMSYGYDNANRVETIAHVKTPTTIESLTYVNDAAGNRTKLTRANAAASLIPAAVTADYDAANEQIKFNSPTVNLVYDNNGNLTSFTDGSGTTTYTWNARNQMTAISGPGLTASLVYDGLGRRTSKTINSTTTGYWYDGQDILAELNGSTVTASYIRSLDIDEPFIRQAASNDFYQTDALGSTPALTDAAGSAQTTYTYEPFGKTTVNGTSSNPHQFSGRENDGTGTYYYRARYYQPKSPRFIGEDPIGLAGGMNVYTYVENNPLLWKDPLGLMSMRLILPRVPPPPPNQPKPPGWNPNWEWRYPEPTNTQKGPRWFDEKGGEWRWHRPDKWHENGHWDYNPWDKWNSPWRNVPPGMVPPVLLPGGSNPPGLGGRKDSPDQPMPDWQKQCALDPMCS
jgi:RHS repeat-associated protein